MKKRGFTKLVSLLSIGAMLLGASVFSNAMPSANDKQFKIAAQSVTWGATMVNAPKSWDSHYTGKGVKIAILDTGISPHPDLKIAGGVSFVPGVSSYNDDNGHGTEVAGVIGSQNNSIGYRGIAPDAQLYSVKVMDKNGSGSVLGVLAGINWAIQNDMDIINLSFCSSVPSAPLQTMINKANSAGILVVAAAGNSGNSAGTGSTISYPARYPGAIAVGAIGFQPMKRASYSSTGPELEVVAPGVTIPTTTNKGGYTYASGTSMAAPYVSGDLALLKQANPNMSATQLRQLLDKKVIPMGPKTQYGYGLIQTP